MQATFFALADSLTRDLVGSERLLLTLSGESTDYVRYNRAAIRQPGHLRQATLELRLIDGARHAAVTVELSEERDLIGAQLALLRSILPELPEDPHLLVSETRADSVRSSAHRIDPGPITETWLASAAGTDAVGFQMSGTLYRGFADSAGQRNWFERDSYAVDSSLHVGDRSIKLSAAGLSFDPTDLQRSFQAARAQLGALERPLHDLAPGAYRAYFAPSAVADLFGLLSHSAFGVHNHERGTSCLRRAVEGEALSPLLHAAERTSTGLGPSFDDRGFIKPDETLLLAEGRIVGALANAASAKEFGAVCTGAGKWESTDSLDISPGTLAESDVLQALGTGLYISDVHYLNFSDYGACHLTGLTRFACYWVENGAIIAPIPTMRFDDDMFRLFGTELEQFTDRSVLLPQVRTYPRRSPRSSRVPGALVSAFQIRA